MDFTFGWTLHLVFLVIFLFGKHVECSQKGDSGVDNNLKPSRDNVDVDPPIETLRKMCVQALELVSLLEIKLDTNLENYLKELSKHPFPDYIQRATVAHTPKHAIHTPLTTSTSSEEDKIELYVTTLILYFEHLSHIGPRFQKQHAEPVYENLEKLESFVLKETFRDAIKMLSTSFWKLKEGLEHEPVFLDNMHMITPVGFFRDNNPGPSYSVSDAGSR